MSAAGLQAPVGSRRSGIGWLYAQICSTKPTDVLEAALDQLIDTCCAKGQRKAGWLVCIRKSFDLIPWKETVVYHRSQQQDERGQGIAQENREAVLFLKLKLSVKAQRDK